MAGIGKSSRRTRSRRGSSGALWNILTVVALVATLCIAGLFLMIFFNPGSTFNPFPPPTQPVALVLPTARPTSLNQLPPTWTPTSPVLPTQTQVPSQTPSPTVTPTLLILPTWTLTPTPTATKPPRFRITGSSPSYAVAPGHSCSWMGVGGNVVDLDGEPVQGLTVFLGGEYEGKTLRASTTSGSATVHGEGGFELFIDDDPGPSRDTAYVQLRDSSGIVLSDQYYFRTFDDCSRNLIRIDFVQSQ